MFLILLQYVKPISAIQHYTDKHKEFLKKHSDAGTFLLCGEKKPRSGELIICKAETRKQVENIIREDPFDQFQLAFYEVIEFQPDVFDAKFDNYLLLMQAMQNRTQFSN